MSKPSKAAEERYVRRVGDYVLDILPENDERAENVLAYVKEHLHERRETYPRYKYKD